MTDTAADPTFGKLPTPSRLRSRRRARRRDHIPGIAASACLLLSYFLFGAGEPIAALVVSACLIMSALAAIAVAGPHRVTPVMLLVPLLIWLFAATGLAGNLERATPQLASLFAAGAIWTIGYICARQRGALDIGWTAVVWTAMTYCIWIFFSHIGDGLSTPNAAIDAPLGSPAAASLLFGLFSLVGSSRVLHVVKQMDAEALSRSEMIDRLMRDGLGGLLLLGFALTCLILTSSLAGVFLTASALLIHAWWDTHAIITRDHRGTGVRWLGRAMPFLAMGLGAWGVAHAFLYDESVTASAALGDAPRLARLTAYVDAFRNEMWLGHGLGSIAVVGAQETTLANALAMQGPGNAQNVFVHWLVEVGIVGSLALLLVIGAIHTRILRGFRGHMAPRTFLRLAIIASGFMLLHGIADSSLDLPSAVWLYAFILGAACGVATGRRTQRQEQPI